MNEAEQPPLAELRRRQPAIGRRQAAQLLARTAGDVAAALRLFEEPAVATVSGKCSERAWMQ